MTVVTMTVADATAEAVTLPTATTAIAPRRTTRVIPLQRGDRFGRGIIINKVRSQEMQAILIVVETLNGVVAVHIMNVIGYPLVVETVGPTILR